MREHQRLVPSERRKLVCSGNEGKLKLAAQIRADLGSEVGMGIQPGPHRRAPDRELIESRLRRIDRLGSMLELSHVAGELLSERQRRGVLQVRAPDLDDGAEGRALSLKRL